jgi:hypothetical protein
MHVDHVSASCLLKSTSPVRVSEHLRTRIHVAGLRVARQVLCVYACMLKPIYVGEPRDQPDPMIAIHLAATQLSGRR